MNGGRRTRNLTLLAALMAAAASCGCRSRPPVPVAKPQQLLGRPAIDLSRGGAGFPLVGTVVPTTAAELVGSLLAGYAERLKSAEHVTIDAFPALAAADDLASLSIDISGSEVRPDFAPKEQPKVAEPVTVLRTKRLRYVADPLAYEHYAAVMRLDAKDAALAVLPAADGTLGLSLVDCSTAHARLRLSLAGLRESLAGGMKAKSAAAFRVDSVDLNLASDSPWSLSLDALIHARLLLLKSDFRVTGRVDVDEAFNVHFTGLNATGIGATGKLVAGVVQTKLDKLNGRAAPLLKLPGDRIHVSDFRLDLGDELTVDVALRGSVR